MGQIYRMNVVRTIAFPVLVLVATGDADFSIQEIISCVRAKPLIMECVRAGRDFKPSASECARDKRMRIRNIRIQLMVFDYHDAYRGYSKGTIHMVNTVREYCFFVNEQGRINYHLTAKDQKQSLEIIFTCMIKINEITGNLVFISLMTFKTILMEPKQ